MITETDVFNSYNVQFVFDFTVISTTIFAMHEDACKAMAIEAINSELDLPEGVLEGAQDVIIELLDRDVL